MPDRYGDRDDADASVASVEAAPIQSPTEAVNERLRASQEAAMAAENARLAGIPDCPHCDQDGYRGSTPCDHTPPASPETRAAARAALAAHLNRETQ